MDGTNISYQDILNAVVQGSGTSWGLKVIPFPPTSPAATPRSNHYRQVILHSITTASGSATGTVLGSIGQYKTADIYYNVTLATGTTPTLLAYVDSRLDGTNWANIGQFPVATGTLYSFAVHLDKTRGADAVYAATDVTADAGAGSFRPIGWADDMRIRVNITGTTPSYSAVWTINLA